MIIALGSDHAGFEEPAPYYKPALIKHLQETGHQVVDCGSHDATAVDYPDIAGVVCSAISNGQAEAGVLLCGTGIGMSIAANRHLGIRAAVCTTPEMAELARAHNDANILCLGRRTSTLPDCLAILDRFLTTPFSGVDRHQRRVNKMG